MTRKILYFSSVDVSLTVGPSVNEREFIPILFELLGKDVHFIIPEPIHGLPSEIPSDVCTFTKNHYQRSPLPWLLHQISIIVTCKKVLSRNEFDFFLFRFGLLPFAYWYLAKRYNLPFAIKHASNGKFEVFDKQGVLWKPFKFINFRLFKKLVSRAFMVDVVSLQQQKSLREVTGEDENIVWIDNGVNTNRFFPKDSEQIKKKLELERFSHIIGYVGNLAWERGGKQIIESLPALVKEYPNIGAVILGSGSKMTLLHEKAKMLGVNEHCCFTGQVDYEEVVNYINCFDVGVSLRYEDTQHASELKVRQYIACGKPVIVSPGSNNFVETEGIGTVIDPYDIGQFVKAALYYINMDKKTYANLAMKARQYALKEFSYKSKVEEKVKLWNKMLPRD